MFKQSKVFKKSKVYLILLVIICTAVPAAKGYLSEISASPSPPAAAQAAGQDPASQTADSPNPPSHGVSAGTQNEVMTVHFLDVGQADSIFIDFGPYEILVDGGNNGDGQHIADYIKPYVDGDLELIVGTHAHEDHIGGLDTIISDYQVDNIIYSDETSATKTFQDFYNAAASEPNCNFIGDSDMTFDLGHGAQFKIMEMGDGYKDPNRNSVVSMIDYNDVEVLLMGDLESGIEKSNLNKFSDVDVIKLGHHGSKTATSQAFLDVVKPEVSIISAGVNNKYKLPNEEVIDRLHAMNSAIYGTFRSGNIIMTTDGAGYTFNTDIQLTAKDAEAPALPN